MFESYLYEALERVLGAYVQNLDQQSLKMAVLKGEVTLDGLQLKEDAFAALGCPVRVRRGCVGHMTLIVPWLGLTSSTTTVKIEDVHLLLEPCEWTVEQQQEAFQRHCQLRSVQALTPTLLFPQAKNESSGIF